MSHRRRPTVLLDGLDEHPAVKAWVATTSTQAMVPTSVLVMRERDVGAVYNLPGVANGAAVFAKRSRTERNTVERAVYEHILPHLPLATPPYHGAMMNDRYGWIFVGDVGSERYREEEAEHRALAARWLATMHTAAVDIPAVRSLPTAGPARYLKHLRVGRERIVHYLHVWTFPANEREILDRVVSYCKDLEGRWARVESLCNGTPRTLVHCDFRPNNVYVTRGEAGLVLWLIDWEMAGYGPPAVDLTRIDPRIYWLAIRSAWPEVTLETIERQALGGRVLQWAAAIDWESASLKCRKARDRSDAVLQLRIAHDRLTAAARAAGVAE